jgi:hypothetical protein
MRSLYPIFIASLTLALPAFPQAILEHSAAAAGASIGTAAGKSLSNSMEKIFGNMEENTVHAAGVTKEDKKKKDKALEPETAPQNGAADSTTTDTDGTPAASRPKSRHAKVAAKTQPATAPAPLISIPAPEPPAKEPALADLLSVKTGAREESLTASLGQPTSRVTIPDDGHLVEILRYTAAGQLLGVIRVDNGEVVNVLPAGQPR